MERIRKDLPYNVSGIVFFFFFNVKLDGLFSFHFISFQNNKKIEFFKLYAEWNNWTIVIFLLYLQ